MERMKRRRLDRKIGIRLLRIAKLNLQVKYSAYWTGAMETVIRWVWTNRALQIANLFAWDTDCLSALRGHSRVVWQAEAALPK